MYTVFQKRYMRFNENLRWADLPYANPVEFALAYAEWAASYTGFYFEAGDTLRQLEQLRMHAI